MAKTQSPQTLENIAAAKRLWDDKQATKKKTMIKNAEARSKRSDSDQVKLCKSRRGKSVKEIERLTKE